MDHFSSQCISLVSFDKIYSQNIRPKLEEIDIFLKSNTPPYSTSDIATLLSVDLKELLDTMNKLEVSKIDKISFFNLLFDLPSYICKLIKRQWQYGSPRVYNAYIISHIYQLNIHKVQNAFQELDIEYIQEKELHLIFERIYTTIFTM